MADEQLEILARYRDVERLRDLVAHVTRASGSQPDQVGEATRYHYANGAGDTAIWIFAPEDRVLLLTFDHESRLSFYDRDGEAQRGMYAGLPGDLHAYVEGQKDDDVWLTMRVANTRYVAATGVFYLVDGEWHLTDGLATLLAGDEYRPRDTGLRWLLRSQGFEVG